MKRALAVVMPVALIVLIAVFEWLRIQRMPACGAAQCADAGFAALYLAWMLYELSVARADAAADDARADRHTRELYGIAHALTVLSALWSGPYPDPPGFAHLAGVVVFVAGVSLRLYAIRTLGARYSHLVRIDHALAIVSDGPYRFIRHPAYAGMLIAHAGVAIFFPNGVTAAVYCFMLVPSLLVRIRVEERALMGRAGYREFAENRARLVPGLW